MKISGVMPLRNAVKLGYPFELAIKSLRPLCDEVVILVDPMSEDDTFERVKRVLADRVHIVLSVWDMNNHRGHTNCEISVQTAKVIEHVSGDWIMSLQADEVLHERDAEGLREEVELAERNGVTGIELQRLYFYGSLSKIRADWTQWLLRLFKRGCWKPDVDGAMRFDPVGEQCRVRALAAIYHYSRVGDPQVIAERVRNLDGFFHEPQKVEQGAIRPYDFSQLRELDTYVIGSEGTVAKRGSLVNFDVDWHPAGVKEHFGCQR